MTKIKVHYIETKTATYVIDSRYVIYQDWRIYKIITEKWLSELVDNQDNKWLFDIKDKLMKGIL